MAKYGVGIIGTGWVSGEYVKAFDQLADTEVKAIAGRSEEKARAKAKEFDVSCDAYGDYRKMLERDDIHIVVIATAPHVHCEQAVAAAQAGKHLVLEKAMAPKLDECRQIRDAVEKAGVKSVVSFVLRWNSLFKLIKKYVDDGAIGDPIYSEVDYLHGIGPWYAQFAWNVKKEGGGSSLLSAGCHALDALRFFMGGEIVEVFQYGHSGKGPDFAAYEYDPTTMTMCRFSDGRIGKVTSCLECVQPYIFNIHLVGTHGTIRNNQFYSKVEFPEQTGWVEVPTILPDSGDVRHHPFLDEASHFVECLNKGQDSSCSIAESYRTHEVVFAGDLSQEQGKPVSLPLP